MTSVARTLLDLAATEPEKVVEQALAEALSRRFVRESQVRALCAHHCGCRGAARLLALLDGGPGLLRSELEARFLALVTAARLPKPQVNVKVEGLEVDFLWRNAKLVVEADSLRFHRTRAAQRRDHERDGILLPAGYRVLRVNWKQIEEEPVWLVATLTRLLFTPAPTPAPAPRS